MGQAEIPYVAAFAFAYCGIDLVLSDLGRPLMDRPAYTAGRAGVVLVALLWPLVAVWEVGRHIRRNRLGRALGLFLNTAIWITAVFIGTHFVYLLAGMMTGQHG